MSHNTIALNQQRQPLDHLKSVWLFGYGSLIYKADFPFIQRKPARIRGWARRFWQGSHDHRGTPEKPGRVATLIEAPEAVCAGMAYEVTPDVFAHLDHREKNGYLRIFTEFEWLDEPGSVEGLVYIAGPDNAAFLGDASATQIAQHIANSHGPSGPNDEYLLKLAEALRELGEHDDHVFAIERELLALASE
ncbi:gamma-glutamylcyclotransferase [Pseudidiomarina donghaiensis]|jgi:cation transport regulator ChaC|uniref:glutathione-specific gamma-glutamylcyclotransferase n=1 Tax=Pseudidiomarina donghaiensis TaxID=519452 RepID=A0A432XGV4_9GAMM|nr:gamma-glutamylcyclotransferase [Pseudidiomarina donghaiensis]MBR9908345.1 gamma-glutamylcyclotransferase [Gammaproteobacteria bacterium]RUO47846.1 gamma-glutamylcyclotransferase [Pseudidiomarina donghaiensis]SFV22432.1 Cation transport regulator ChaC [Pseudidiomarina donghaiensis]